MCDSPAAPQLSVTVAICAYTDERWNWIQEAVSSVRCQTRPVDQIVLVVDHNPGLLIRARAAFPMVDVVANTGERGLSGGKNTALEHAGGDLIAFLDDDAAADSDWVETLSAHFDDPGVLSVGSRVDPLWEEEPGWFPPEFYWTLGCSHVGLPESVEEVRNSFGGATMVRTSAARRVGGFASELGRVLGNAGGGEETEFCIRLRSEVGGSVLYDPSTAITHRVPSSRCSWRYLVARCRGEGRSKAILRRRVGSDLGLASERDFVRRVLPVAYRRELGRVLRGDPEGARAMMAISLGLTSTVAGFAAEEWRSAQAVRR